MRIGIDAACWFHRRGYGRFLRGLLGALLDLESAHEYLLFLDSAAQDRHSLPAAAGKIFVRTRFASIEAASHAGNRSPIDLLRMATAVARQRLDAFFFPTVYTFFPLLSRVPVILGVHDVIAEDYPALVFPRLRGRWLWRLKGRLAHRRADYVMTVSEYSRQGILRHFHHPPERIRVVGEAPDPVFRPLAKEMLDLGLLRRHGIASGDRFLLYLGGVNPHKNLPALLDGFGRLARTRRFEDVRLVLVGEVADDPFTPGLAAVEKRIERLALSDRIAFTGYLEDAEVVHLLNAARALVLPSFAEGFGLPAVEAAACGTPVIATRNSPLPELLAGGGLFIDPARPEELTAALERLLGDEEERRRLAGTALTRARELSWRRSAEQMLELLATVAGERA